MKLTEFARRLAPSGVHGQVTKVRIKFELA
jgi:hypothetical protein